MQVGFAGLGRMGVPMARNLARAGHTVKLWTRSGEKARDLAAELGCTAVARPKDLSDAADVIVTMLADDAASEVVHLGPDGLFAGSAKTYVEMGTMSPGHIATLAAAAPEDAAVIDAPVSGATQAAQDAALLIMAGCTETEADTVMPLFDAMGHQTICLGKHGLGAVMKLSVNALIHGINQTLAEAMTLAEASGISPVKAFDVIEASAACAPMLKYRRPLYLDEAAQDVTFTVALARKDMQVTAELSKSLGTPMVQGRATLDALLRAEAEGYGKRDMAAMLAFAREERT